MRPEIKACKECKYCKEYSGYGGTWNCSHPEIVEPSVIVGGYAEVGAHNARHKGKCGIEAKYWEVKK